VLEQPEVNRTSFLVRDGIGSITIEASSVNFLLSICKTRKLTKRTENPLRIVQRAMKRALLGIAMRERHRSTWIRAKTGVKYMVQVVEKQKWRWAGHIARMNSKRLTKRIRDWLKSRKNHSG